MEMYCRDCGKNRKVRKEKSKDNYTKATYYYCDKCGVLLSIIYSNRRMR